MTIRNIAISCRQFFLISTCPFRYTFLLLLPPPHSSLIVVTFTLFLLFFFSTSCTHVRSFPCQTPFHHTFTSSAFILSFSKTIEQAFEEYEKFVRKAKQCFETLLPLLDTLKRWKFNTRRKRDYIQKEVKRNYK